MDYDVQIEDRSLSLLEKKSSFVRLGHGCRRY